MRLIDREEMHELINWSYQKPPYSRKKIHHMIDMAQTVEAVPIEWLKQWEEKHKEDPCYCNIVSEEILKDWEKENETD